MSTFTDERAAKVAGNLAVPEIRTVEQFAADLRGVGVDPEIVSISQLRSALDLRGKAIESMDLSSKPLVEQDSKLTFIIDALGPNGENILTENGLIHIRAAEISQGKLASFNSGFDNLAKHASAYSRLAPIIRGGLDAFEGIVGIVDTQKLRGGGEIVLFDMNDPKDQRLSQTLKEYVDLWVESEMGDPRLAELTPDELLIACANFPAADRKAFHLSHPDLAGKSTGEYFSYSIESEFEAIAVQSITREDGSKAIFKGIDPGPTTQVTTGPLDR